MGLIKAAAALIGAASGALNTTANSIWVDYFESGDMSNGVIMKRGEKIIGPKSQNKHGDQNIITSGSGIDVQANQCMILVENGAIVDFCAEPGRYTFDASLAPSLFHGENKGLKALGKTLLQQFSAGGQRTSTQRVYYINLGEIQGFKWGTGNIVFDHWEKDLLTDRPIWHIATTLKGNGVYSIQVTDPAKFFEVIGASKTGTDGNGLVTRADIEDQIKTEAIAAIRQGVAGLSQLRIPYTEIGANEAKLTQDVDAILDQSWNEARGISIFKIAIGLMDADDKSKEQITKFQETRGYTDPSMLGAYMGMGQTQAMQAAGANTSGGTNSRIMGLAGLGMVQGMNGSAASVANLMQQGAAQQAQQQAMYQQQMAQQQYQQPAPAAPAAPAPEAPKAAEGWTCPQCGSINTMNFCANCGTKKPAAPAACANCGQAFDPANPPKFCPNCGTKVE